MSHRSFGTPSVISAILILMVGAEGFAAQLPLTPLLSSERDLLQVEGLTDGTFHVLHQGGVDRLGVDGWCTPLLASTSSQRAFLGDGGAYFGRASFRSGAVDFAPTAAFELYESGAGRRWVIGETEDVSYAISVRGVVVGQSLNINTPERNALRFYGAGGRLEAEVLVPHLVGGRFSADGTVFLAARAIEGLVAFSPAGVERWRHPGARIFAATPSGEVVAVIAEGRLEVVHDGSVMASVDLGGLLVRRIAIAVDAGRIAVAGREELRVFDGELRPVWSQSLLGTEYVYTSVDLGATPGWLLAGVARDLGRGLPVHARHPDGRIQVYDPAGNLCHEAPITFETWNIFTPTARISPSGLWATVTTRRAVYRLELP